MNLERGRGREYFGKTILPFGVDRVRRSDLITSSGLEAITYDV